MVKAPKRKPRQAETAAKLAGPKLTIEVAGNWPGQLWEAERDCGGAPHRMGILVTEGDDIDRPIAFVDRSWFDGDDGLNDAQRYVRCLLIAIDIAQHPENVAKHRGPAWDLRSPQTNHSVYRAHRLSNLSFQQIGGSETCGRALGNIDD